LATVTLSAAFEAHADHNHDHFSFWPLHLDVRMIAGYFGTALSSVIALLGVVMM
jgi:hypothetical protein